MPIWLVSLRKTLLVIALVDWCAALSFAVLVCSGPRELVRDGRLLALDRAGFVRRARAALARDGRSLLVALLACASFLLCETTAFDLAQISTYGFELRTLDALGAAPATVVRAALPAIAIVLAIVLTMVVLLPAISRATGDAALRSRSDGSAVTRSRAAPALLLVGLPTAIVVLALARVVLAVPRFRAISLRSTVAPWQRRFWLPLRLRFSSAPSVLASVCCSVRARVRCASPPASWPSLAL